MRLPLDDIEIVRPKDDSYQKMMLEVDNLTEDISTLNQVKELVAKLHCGHSALEDVVKDMLGSLHKQLNEQQNTESQLSCLDLTFQSPHFFRSGTEYLSIIFPNAEKRTTWEEAFTDAKQNLAMSSDRRPIPEIVATVPIRKTRAGLQFTCAAPTLEENRKEVWVCNSDGYVGQLCVLSLTPEPNVTSCNGVCSARILCITSVPGIKAGQSLSPSRSKKSGRTRRSRNQRRLKPMYFDSSSSTEEDVAGPSEERQTSSETDRCSEEGGDRQPSTMWLGTEDGCIHVYNSTDNIRTKKNKIKVQLGAAILCIVYSESRVYVSLANGDLTIFERDPNASWNTSSPSTLSVGSLSIPISKMVPGAGKLLCICGCVIKMFNTDSMSVENSFSASNDANKPIVCTILNGHGIWLSLQNTAILKCYHVTTLDLIFEINVAPAVTKMLTSCDDIIRQHKAACLRITAMVTCKDLLWIGTSAGVLLTMPLPHIPSKMSSKVVVIPPLNGVHQGHTGHVRFLTCVEVPIPEATPKKSWKGKEKRSTSNIIKKNLVISGGDGFEDFRSSNLSEVAGREDSTNHLLLWNV
nr:unnamed protein product [Callosobruchus chinensis]